MALGRIRMTALAATAALATAGLAALPADASVAAKVRVTIAAIDSNSVKVAVLGSIYPVAGQTMLVQPGKAVRIRPGAYWFGASVPTMSSGAAVRQTLVLRKVTIRHGGAVVLSAVAGREVQLQLTGATAAAENDYLEACVHGTFVSGAAAPAGTLYAVPVKSPSMQISYATTWQSVSASYALAGRSRGGIPAPVSHTASSGRMAKVNMKFYAGTDPDTYHGLLLQAAGKGCAIPTLGLAQSLLAGSAQVFMTPGRWTPQAYTLSEDLQGTYTYRAGHHYTDRFGRAVVSPAATFPSRTFSLLSYQLTPGLFADRDQAVNLQCCAKASITLRRGSRVLARSAVDTIDYPPAFIGKLRRSGWYTLKVAASRAAGTGPAPSWLLSPHVAVEWRFHNPGPSGRNGSKPLAASVTKFLPLGLSIDNQAAPGSTTKLAITVERARGNYLNSAGYNVKTIVVQASVDGGKTWHALKLTRHGGGWIGAVHNPPSGFVSLRSTVTDGHGDSTVQTIDQAYGIS